MSKKNEDYEILSISKKQIIIYFVLMWAGVIVGVLSFFIKNNVVAICSIAGGLIAILGVMLQIFTVKCPYCGKHKVGRAISMGMKEPVYCPDCNKRIDLK